MTGLSKYAADILLGISRDAIKKAFFPPGKDHLHEIARQQLTAIGLMENYFERHYREALMLIEERRYSEALVAARKAVTADELNVDALRLHIDLLREDDDEATAASRSMLLLDRFGFRKGDVPGTVFEPFAAEFHCKPLDGQAGSSTEFLSYAGGRSTGLWCSRTAIATYFDKGKAWADWLFGDRCQIDFRPWSGSAESLTLTDQRHGRIVALTNHYLAIENKQDGQATYSVYNAASGAAIVTQSVKRAPQLFSMPASCRSDASTMTFAGRRISAGERTKWYEVSVRGSGGCGRTTESRSFRVGYVDVTAQPV